MLRKAIAIVYIATLIVELLFLPISAILIIIKLCGATALSWLGCCIFAIIAIGLSPFFLVAKIILDGGTK